MEEIWKDVKGFEGLYAVSNLGNVKSLDRHVNATYGTRFHKGKILNKILDKRGYYNVHLSNGSLRLCKRIHILVSESFLNHTTNQKIVVDHINNIQSDNRLINLQIIQQRLNNTKDRKRVSGFPGAYKSGNKWRSFAQDNYKKVHLGMFNCPLAAHVAYNKFVSKCV